MKILFISLWMGLFAGSLWTPVDADTTLAAAPLATATPAVHHHHHKNKPLVMTSAASTSGTTAIPPSPYAAPGVTPTLNPSAVYGFTATGAPFKESPTMP